jgi:hypothetical protein
MKNQQGKKNNHGGPRSNSGGQRVGAGRKPYTDEPTVEKMFVIEESQWNWLTENFKNRSEAVNALIKQARANSEQTC